MPESAEPNKKAGDITRLLSKAVKGLPKEEQRAVYEYFFERGIAGARAPVFGRLVDEAAQLRGPAEPGPWHEAGALATPFTTQKPIGPGQITIPVRLSEAQHQRLKQWSAEHNFPMAVIVRGLIERFLDSWEERAA
ncbi:hypothetical protein BH20ACT19_BH20ACT19_09740 [soil metagenome]